jgi:hypothetical protein
MKNNNNRKPPTGTSTCSPKSNIPLWKTGTHTRNTLKLARITYKTRSYNKTD